MRLKLRPSYRHALQMVLGGTRGGIGSVGLFAAWPFGLLSVRKVPMAVQNYKFASSFMLVMTALRHVRTLSIMGLMAGTCLRSPLSLRSQTTSPRGLRRRERYFWNNHWLYHRWPCT